MILKYVLAVLIPIIVIVLENKEYNLFEATIYLKQKFILCLIIIKKQKKHYLVCLTKNKDSYKAHKSLAEIYEKEGGMRKAIDEYVQAIDLDKQDYDSYYKVAKLLKWIR